MNKLLGLLLLLSFSIPKSLACELPRGQKLVVGSSYDLDYSYRLRLQMAALRLGYPLQFVDLRKNASFDEALTKVDAVLIPGGADINPEYYMDQITPELQEETRSKLHLVNFSKEGAVRDPFEYGLLKTYSADENYRELPLLGICRGMQMMSVAQGIPLYVDIKTEVGIKNRYRRFDRVYINNEDSIMNEIFRKNRIFGFKLHHQGIRVPYYLDHQSEYPLTRVTSFSNNNQIAESIEYTHRPALGVQYHPEKSFAGAAYPIFKWFLTKSCEYKNSYKENL